MLANIETTLLPDEVDALAHHEAVIRDGLDTFYAVADAITAIKMDKLYRQDHASWNEYCAARWAAASSMEKPQTTKTKKSR